MRRGILDEPVPLGSPRSKRGVPRSNKPTLRTIAGMTGLAITTISRALNNAPELSAETRERVQKIAAEIGYVPDRTALRLKTGRTNVISVVLDPHEEILNFSQSLIAGVADALRGTSYHLVITPAFRGASPLEPIQYILRNRMADGVIFSRTEPNDARVKLLIESDFPFVSHGRTDLGVHPYVDYDNYAFAHAAVTRLVKKGRRRVALITPPARFTFARHLMAGFESAVREQGIESEILNDVTLDDNAETIRQVAVRRIKAGNAPDAYVCPGDAVALAVMAGIADAGQTLGVEADIVTKQMSGIFSLVRPRVDVVAEDIALAGLQMGQLLLRRINGEPADALTLLQAPDIPF
jgi:LacI family transcriptional regulator